MFYGSIYYNSGMNGLINQYSLEYIKEIISNNKTIHDVLKKIGYKNVSGGAYRTFKNFVKKYNIDCSHFVFNNEKRKVKLSDSDIFKKGSNCTQSSLRKRVLKKNLVPYKCAICGNIGEWNNKPLTLTLDHINGDRTDNRIENLQFVCPNCDKQQETFGSKNKKRYYSIPRKYKDKNKCKICGKEIEPRAQLCRNCYLKNLKPKKLKSKLDKQTIINELMNFKSFVELGKKYNISDNAFRKWCKKYNLPSSKKELKEWLNKGQ